MPDSQKNYILTMICPDTSGISADVMNFIFKNGGFITSSYNYGDPETQNYFMRTVFNGVGSDLGSIDEIRAKFKPLGEKYNMEWQINDYNKRPKVLIAVSKFGHCLNDLLHKTKDGQLPIEIAAVVSNHADMQSLTEWYGVEYHHLPITPETKHQQELEFIRLIEHYDVDLIVLARYMQVLSTQMCGALSGKCINIHHSFLPSFKGAAPYKQAYIKGVKIVGATAHYVTCDLDEGPIIEQAVERVDHTFSVEDIAMTVRDLETVILSRAVKWHAERRILLNGNKTVVFK